MNKRELLAIAVIVILVVIVIVLSARMRKSNTAADRSAVARQVSCLDACDALANVDDVDCNRVCNFDQCRDLTDSSGNPRYSQCFPEKDYCRTEYNLQDVCDCVSDACAFKDEDGTQVIIMSTGFQSKGYLGMDGDKIVVRSLEKYSNFDMSKYVWEVVGATEGSGSLTLRVDGRTMGTDNSGNATVAAGFWTIVSQGNGFYGIGKVRTGASAQYPDPNEKQWLTQNGSLDNYSNEKTSWIITPVKTKTYSPPYNRDKISNVWSWPCQNL